jgi:hypothetical protein
MGGNDLTECSSVLSSSGGAKNPGEACTQDQDCASSTEGKVACATSYSSGGAQTKVCQVQIKGKAGDAPCVATIDGDISYLTSSSTTPPSKGYTCDLADHLYCDTSGVSSNPPDAGQPPPKCTAQQDVGGPCTSSYGHECVKTAYCDYAQHKCMARVATGGDCSASSSSCAPGNNCDGTSKKCVAQLANGATCTAAAQCLSGQCVNGACAASQSLTLQMLCAAK